MKQLQDFVKVYLDVGERKKVELRARKSDIAYFDEVSNSFVEEDIKYTAYIGNSSAEEALVKINFRY